MEQLEDAKVKETIEIAAIYIRELLPGIDKFLKQILAKENLSKLAERQRQFYVERLEIIQLPPHLPPKAPDNEKKIPSTSGRVTSPHAGRELPVPKKQTDEFIAQQRMLSRQFECTSTNPVPNNGEGADSDQYDDGLYEEPVPLNDLKLTVPQAPRVPPSRRAARTQPEPLYDSDHMSSTSYETYDEVDFTEEPEEEYVNAEIKTGDIRLPSSKKKRKKKTKSKPNVLDRLYGQLDNIFHEGEIYYKGKISRTSWSKKLCVISNGIFYCYKDLESKPIISISLFGYDAILLDEKEKGRANVLRLSHPGVETHFLSTDSPSESQSWLNRLETACTSAEMSHPSAGAAAIPQHYSSQSSVETPCVDHPGPHSPSLNGQSARRKVVNTLSHGDGLRKEKKGFGRFLSDTFGRKKGLKIGLLISEGTANDPLTYDPAISIAGVINISSDSFLGSDPKWQHKQCLVRNGVFECYRDDSTSSDLEFSLNLAECELQTLSHDPDRPLALNVASKSGDTVLTLEPVSKLDHGDWLKALLNHTGYTGDTHVELSSAESGEAAAKWPDDIDYTYVDTVKRNVTVASTAVPRELNGTADRLSERDEFQEERHYADLSDHETEHSGIGSMGNQYDQPPQEAVDRLSKLKSKPTKLVSKVTKRSAELLPTIYMNIRMYFHADPNAFPLFHYGSMSNVYEDVADHTSDKRSNASVRSQSTLSSSENRHDSSKSVTNTSICSSETANAILSSDAGATSPNWLDKISHGLCTTTNSLYGLVPSRTASVSSSGVMSDRIYQSILDLRSNSSDSINVSLDTFVVTQPPLGISSLGDPLMLVSLDSPCGNSRLGHIDNDLGHVYDTPIAVLHSENDPGSQQRSNSLPRYFEPPSQAVGEELGRNKKSSTLDSRRKPIYDCSTFIKPRPLVVHEPQIIPLVKPKRDSSFLTSSFMAADNDDVFDADPNMFHHSNVIETVNRVSMTDVRPQDSNPNDVPCDFRVAKPESLSPELIKSNGSEAGIGLVKIAGLTAGQDSTNEAVSLPRIDQREKPINNCAEDSTLEPQPLGLNHKLEESFTSESAIHSDGKSRAVEHKPSRSSAFISPSSLGSDKDVCKNPSSGADTGAGAHENVSKSKTLEPEMFFAKRIFVKPVVPSSSNDPETDTGSSLRQHQVTSSPRLSCQDVPTKASIASSTTSSEAGRSTFSRESSCSSEGGKRVSESIAKSRAIFESGSGGLTSNGSKWQGFKLAGAAPPKGKASTIGGFSSRIDETEGSLNKNNNNTNAEGVKFSGTKSATMGSIASRSPLFDDKLLDQPKNTDKAPVRTVSPIKIAHQTTSSKPPNDHASNKGTKLTNHRKGSLEPSNDIPASLKSLFNGPAANKGDESEHSNNKVAEIKFQISTSGSDVTITDFKASEPKTSKSALTTKTTVASSTSKTGSMNSSPHNSVHSSPLINSPRVVLASPVKLRTDINCNSTKQTARHNISSALHKLTKASDISLSLKPMTEEEEDKRLSELRVNLTQLRKERQKVRDEKLSTLLPEDTERLEKEFKKVDTEYKSTNKEIGYLEERKLKRIQPSCSKASIEARKAVMDSHSQNVTNKRKVWE